LVNASKVREAVSPFACFTNIYHQINYLTTCGVPVFQPNFDAVQRFWSTLFLLLISSGLSGQSPVNIRVMSYNLTYFRAFTSFCTTTNNPPGAKEAWLNTVVAHTQPDILVCNEVDGSNATAHGRILNFSLNANGTTRWAATDLYTNGSSLINAVYYDQNKLGLKSQSIISNDLQNNTLVRGIDVMRFYYKDSLLAWNPDTLFFTVFAAHLKAGNTASDLTERQKACEALMYYLASNPRDDVYLLAGDLNMTKSQEAGFQQLLNYSNAGIRFKDPENVLGNWNNNGTFAAWHTQSTRDGLTNDGCFSGGGLDDRYDHILVNSTTLTSSSRMRYLSGSLRPIGNDGLHFNSSITSGTNNSVPATVLTALYELSDHLPVVADFELDRLGIGLPEFRDHIQRSTDLDGHTVLQRIESNEDWTVEVFDPAGRIIVRSSWPAGELRWRSDALFRGWVTLRITDASGRTKFAAPQ
jgi:endonuclease/exonuclease/phosphatase family metal-dependent hydrolase